MTILDHLRAGCSSTPSIDRPSGLEIRQELEPAGGLPVAPPSYEGRLEIHDRHVDGQVRKAIELDSIGSSANRIEEVLLELHRAASYPLAVSGTTVPTNDGPITITTLEAPHRAYDAWLRLSVEEGSSEEFEKTERGRELSLATMSTLDPLLEFSTHDLLFGSWDSHRKGPNGQVRIARSFTSSIVGFDPIPQSRFAARRDPLNLGEASDLPKGAKRLSEQGLSSVPPQKSIPYEEGPDGKAKTFGGRIADHRGDVSITSARFQGYLSFPALRRLGFARYDDVSVRTVLAALALYGALLRSHAGWDLRARCNLIPIGAAAVSLVEADGTRTPLEVPLAEARDAFDVAVRAAGIADRSVQLKASKALENLVAQSVDASK